MPWPTATPLLAFVGNAQWQHRLDRWAPTTAGLTVQATIGCAARRSARGVGSGYWAAVALAAGAFALRLRDA